MVYSLAVIIITYAPTLPYPHKRKRTNNTTNTRQTDHEHPRRHLIWKDKIRHRSDHNDWSETMRPLEMTSPGNWNMNTQKERYAWKTEHLTQKHGPTQNRETNPKTNHDPAHPEGGKDTSQNQTCIHMTHKTNTSRHFTLFHHNHSHQQKIYQTDTGTNWDTWQQASIHIFPLPHYGCIRPHPQNST